MSKLDNADYCEFAHDTLIKIGKVLGLEFRNEKDDGYTRDGEIIFDEIHEAIENFAENNLINS